MAICAEIKRGTPTVQIKTVDDLLNLFRHPDVLKAIREIRDNLLKAENAEKAGLSDKAKEFQKQANTIKATLPGVCFQANSFKEHRWVDRNQKDHGIGAWRHQEHVVLNGMFIIDIDHVADPRALYQELCDKGLMDWQPMIAFVSPSGHGLKMVFPCDVSRGNLAQNQAAFGKAFGVEIDEKNKDASRLAFVSTEKDIIYFNPQIIDYENKEFIAKWNGRYNDGSADRDLFTDSVNPNSSPAAAPASEQEVGQYLRECLVSLRKTGGLACEEVLEGLKYHGIAVKDLINEYFGGKQPEQGDRHDTMMRFVRDVRHIVDKNEKAAVYWTLKLPFVQDLFKEGDNVERDILDSLAYKYSPYMPAGFKNAIKKLKSEVLQEKPSSLTENLINQRYLEFGEQFKDLFKYYPCMKEATAKFGVASYPAVLFSVACMYGTLATRTWYFHYHEPELRRRLNYEVFVIADPASGKSGIGSLYKIIMQPIIASDKVYNDNINKAKKARKENDTVKDKEKTKIKNVESKVRIHGSRTANNVFIEDMVNNVEVLDGEMIHIHLFTFDAELEAAQVASRGGQWIDKSIFELKAFHNEEDNQQYRNVDSVSGPFDVYWNLVYTGTPYSLYRKVSKTNFGSGLSTRLAVIPLAPDKFKMMPFSKNARVNQGYNETLLTWANRLDSVKGELPIWPLVEHTWKWTDQLMMIAGESHDEALAFLIKRISYYGINCSVPFILMRHWEEWQKSKTLKLDQHDFDLCELFMEVQLFSQKLYFGKMTETYCEQSHKQVEEESSDHMNSKTVIMLRQLPKTFTSTVLVKTCGVIKSYAYTLTSRWVTDGLITKSEGTKPVKYTKTKKGELV